MSEGFIEQLKSTKAVSFLRVHYLILPVLLAYLMIEI